MKKQNPKPVELTLDKGFKDIYHRCKDLSNHCKKHRSKYVNMFCFGITLVFGWPLYKGLLAIMDLYVFTLNKATINGMSDTFELVILSIAFYLLICFGRLLLQWIDILRNSIKDLSEDIRK